MSAPAAKSTAVLVDQGAFLEHLPVPSIYLSLDRRIVVANAAARKIVCPTNRCQPLLGLTIFETDFAKSQIGDLNLLRHHLDLCEASAGGKACEVGVVPGERQSDQNRGQQHLTIPIDEELVSAGAGCLSWGLTLCAVHEKTYFCLTATTRPSFKDVRLSKSEEHEFFRMITEPSFLDMPCYVSLVSADMEFITVNDYGRELHGGFATSIARHKNEKMFWNEDFTKRLDPFLNGAGALSLQNGRGMIGVQRGVELNGTRVMHDISTTLLKNPFTGAALGVVVQTREAEDWATYLQRRDVLNRAFQTPLSDGDRAAMVRTMDIEGELDWFSQTWTHYSGCDQEELCNGSWFRCMHPQDVAKVESAKASSIATCKAIEVEVRYRQDKAGIYRYFRDRFTPLKDIAGSVSRFYCISTDIHDLVMKRQLSQHAVERLYNIVNNMDVTIFTLDSNYVVRSAEGTLEIDTESGLPRASGDYTGRKLHDLCLQMAGPDGIPELESALAQVMDGSTPKVVVDYKIADKFLRTIAVSETNEGDLQGTDRLVTGVLGLTMDLSMEYANEKANLQLEAMKQTDRMKTQFLANVSHELRTPIAGLLGMLELLEETNLTILQQDYSRTINSSAHSLLAIVNDLLDFSKAEANAVVIEKVPFDLPELLGDLCKSNEVLAAKKGLHFALEAVPATRQYLGDAGRIRQILQNLVANAIKFTKNGFVKVTSSSEARYVTCVVEDSGIGIDEATLKTLFRPFAQADQSTTRLYGGSGLGLVIAKKLAQAMGGDVVLESRKGQGTRAILTLALNLPQALPLRTRGGAESASLVDADRAPIQQKVAAKPREAIHILLVEDNVVNKRVALSHLRKLGYNHIVSAENGAEALKHIKAALSGPNDADLAGRGAATTETAVVLPDIILMDCQMPVLDGYDCTKQLRSEVDYQRPIIALTASAIDGDRQRCLDSGMNDYIVKPFTRDQLGQAVERWT